MKAGHRAHGECTPVREAVEMEMAGLFSARTTPDRSQAEATVLMRMEIPSAEEDIRI